MKGLLCVKIALTQKLKPSDLVQVILFVVVSTTVACVCRCYSIEKIKFEYLHLKFS